MTAFEVKPQEELHVLIHASWKDCSGIIVNTTFIQLMIDIVGGSLLIRIVKITLLIILICYGYLKGRDTKK